MDQYLVNIINENMLSIWLSMGTIAILGGITSYLFLFPSKDIGIPKENVIENYYKPTNSSENKNKQNKTK